MLAGYLYPRGLSGLGLSLPWPTLVPSAVLDAHRSSGCCVIVGGGAVTQGVRIRPSDREVKNDREPVVDGIGPCGDVNLVLAHLEELLAVEIPGDLLVASLPAVDHGTVGVVAGLASNAGQQAARQAGELVAGAEATVGIGNGEVPAVECACILYTYD